MNLYDWTRREFLGVSAAAFGTWTAGHAICRADEAAEVDVTDESQLFLDDAIIAKSNGLSRKLHSPDKKGLILEADGSPWQRGDRMSVVRDVAGRFHMTYRFLWEDPSVRDLHPGIGEDRAHWFRRTVGYAQSDDGIHWTKPVLGLIDGPTGFRRAPKDKWKDGVFLEPTGFSKENNLGCPLVSIQDLGCFHGVRDPKRKFLVNVLHRADTHNFAKITDAGLYFASEVPDVADDPDWRKHMTTVWEAARRGARGESTHVSGYIPSEKQWFLCAQSSFGVFAGRRGRMISRWTSPDLESWSPEKIVLPIANDESEDPRDTIEYMDIAVHRAGDAWLGQLSIFHSDRSSRQYEMPTRAGVWRKGTTDIRLMVSRDYGRSWSRVAGKQTWIPHHTEEHGFDRLVFPATPVRVGDELWLYYNAWDGDHLNWNRDGTTYYKDRTRIGRTALATMRWDGYVSLNAGNRPGDLVTRPLRFKGEELRVNLQTTNGSLNVEVQDLAGQPIPGFTLAECVAARGDGVDLPVRWKNHKNLATLAGKTVRLRFQLTDGSWYGFRAV